MNITATAVVIFPRNVPGPLLPKIVWLDPPNTAPMFAPFPACKRTTRIRRIHTMTCTMVIRICTFHTSGMDGYPTSWTNDPMSRLAPPTSAPLMSGSRIKSAIFFGVTLPP